MLNSDNIRGAVDPNKAEMESEELIKLVDGVYKVRRMFFAPLWA